MTLQCFGDYLKYMQGKERRRCSESVLNGGFRGLPSDPTVLRRLPEVHARRAAQMRRVPM